MIKIAIIGLPNIGKSTLFSFLTKKQVLIENYPFATINPNVAIIDFIDSRLKKLQTIYQAKEIIYEKLCFYDIAGLVKGASKGQGLGNQFLSNILETDIICHVVRFFNDVSIIKKGTDSPYENFEIVNLELMLHDLKILKNNLGKIKKQIKAKNNNKLEITYDAMNKAINLLETDNYLYWNRDKLSKDEYDALVSYNLLTLKPIFVLANISESQLKSIQKDNDYIKFCQKLKKLNVVVYPFPLLLLNTIEESVDADEKELFLMEYQDYLKAYLSLSKLLMSIYKLLNYSFFFTCGPKEIHAWKFCTDDNICNASGSIHSSFPKQFIMAKIINTNHVIENPKLADEINYKLVNKTYILKEGDIINIMLNKKSNS